MTSDKNWKEFWIDEMGSDYGLYEVFQHKPLDDGTQTMWAHVIDKSAYTAKCREVEELVNAIEIALSKPKSHEAVRVLTLALSKHQQGEGR